jgi:hypothetical protein
VAVYDADGESGTSSGAEDIDVFGGDNGGKSGIGGGSGGWGLAWAWADKHEVLYEVLWSMAEEKVACVRAPAYMWLLFNDLDI